MAKPPPRLYLADATLAAGASLALPPEHARYLTTVLRLRTGDSLLVFNAQAGEWRATISEAGKRTVSIDVTDCVRPAPSLPYDLRLLFAPVKKAPTEWIIQKATELGATQLCPVQTVRTQAGKLPMDRWAAIATEATEQCERLDVPTITGLQPLEAAIASLPTDAILIFADEAGDNPDQRWGGEIGRGQPMLETLQQAPRAGTAKTAAILIGPAGGFTPAERALIRGDERSIPVTLGPRILKTETAAVVALTLWQAAQGDLAGEGTAKQP